MADLDDALEAPWPGTEDWCEAGDLVKCWLCWEIGRASEARNVLVDGGELRLLCPECRALVTTEGA